MFRSLARDREEMRTEGHVRQKISLCSINERNRANDVEQDFQQRDEQIREHIRHNQIDASAPMEIGMAAKDDGERAREEGYQRIVDLALQAVYRGTGKGTWSFGKGQSWNEKGYQGGKVDNDGWKNPWQKSRVTKGSKGEEKGGKGETRACWTCRKTGHIAAWSPICSRVHSEMCSEGQFDCLDTFSGSHVSRVFFYDSKTCALHDSGRDVLWISLAFLSMEQKQARFLILWIARVEGVAGCLQATQKHLQILALKGRVLRFVTLVGRVVNLSLASVSMKQKKWQP